MRQAEFRYALVFFVTLVLLVFEVVASASAWARAVGVALELTALIIVIATSRAREGVRRARATALALGGTALVALIAADVLSDGVTFLVAGILAAAIPAALIRGLVKLVTDRGVTLQAVAGALTIYLLLGLLFAWVISFVSAVSSTPYFAEGNVTHGDRVYFSFTALTTTGFGDYTAATPTGHAIAVIEMLVGQLYLVTVIGVMVGNFVGRRARA